jgi:hypothetical protein
LKIPIARILWGLLLGVAVGLWARPGTAAGFMLLLLLSVLITMEAGFVLSVILGRMRRDRT